ncbi:hypothetical protein [Paenibacillus elgii]|uniref:hypothetical protein n=1 Tax=Paenibacillus elgii TaxID=189691 RepID=UPI000248D367|nr:hypothetical protein [Paenibacillus elgii]
MNHENIIKQLFAYLDTERQRNLHMEAFKEISNVFLGFHDEYKTQRMQFLNDEKQNERVSWVCDASMGHGKSTVLECFLKWLIDESNPRQRVPVLLVIREKLEAEKLAHKLNEFRHNSCLKLDADNRETMEKYISLYQIVIITHSRLDNLALGMGKKRIYKVWEQYESIDWAFGGLKEPKLINKSHRLLIVDEKPSFVNSATFDVGKANNCLKWFDSIIKDDDADPVSMQSIRTYIMLLMLEQLEKNPTTVTTALASRLDKQTDRHKRLTSLIGKALKDRKMSDLSEFKTMKLFSKLLRKDGIGRIDRYKDKSRIGMKIIVSEKIDYSKIGLNMLVLDGTCHANKIQYALSNFKLKHVKNFNNYGRLKLHQRGIKTSANARTKESESVQETIANDIKKLRLLYGDQMFVIPLDSDIEKYRKFDVYPESHFKYYVDSKQSKKIHLMNTIGKNYLLHYKSLYLTSLPRMHPDFYKEIGIAFYGGDLNLEFNEDNNALKWFADHRLDEIYNGMIYSELLQIIHRSSLRVIEPSRLKDEINIYIAFDDSNGNDVLEFIQPFLYNMNSLYLFKHAEVKRMNLNNIINYGVRDGAEEFIKKSDEWIKNNISTIRESFRKILVSEIGKKSDGDDRLGEKFRKFIQRHKDKLDELNEVFKPYGYQVEMGKNKKDRPAYVLYSLK